MSFSLACLTTVLILSVLGLKHPNMNCQQPAVINPTPVVLSALILFALPSTCAAVDPTLGFSGAHAFLSNKHELPTTITLMVGSIPVAATNSEALFQCQKKPNEAHRFNGLNF